ncbi:hypothetical protein HanIR_Chr11g0538851 [Helianthus annuus]|nr:hypothetical protein HanIR_Chr11g0538851 [Helianthus annuus]
MIITKHVPSKPPVDKFETFTKKDSSYPYVLFDFHTISSIVHSIELHQDSFCFFTQG